jgi:hypothetical protein
LLVLNFLCINLFAEFFLANFILFFLFYVVRYDSSCPRLFLVFLLHFTFSFFLFYAVRYGSSCLRLFFLVSTPFYRYKTLCRYGSFGSALWLFARNVVGARKRGGFGLAPYSFTVTRLCAVTVALARLCGFLLEMSSVLASVTTSG